MIKCHFLLLLLTITMVMSLDLVENENFDGEQGLMYLLKRKDKFGEPQFEIPAHFLRQWLKYRRY